MLDFEPTRLVLHLLFSICLRSHHTESNRPSGYIPSHMHMQRHLSSPTVQFHQSAQYREQTLCRNTLPVTHHCKLEAVKRTRHSLTKAGPGRGFPANTITLVTTRQGSTVRILWQHARHDTYTANDTGPYATHSPSAPQHRHPKTTLVTCSYSDVAWASWAVHWLL